MSNTVILKPNRNRKHYAIEINSDGQIIVRTPAHSSKQIVDQLIQKNQDWIQKRKHQLNQMKQDLSDWIDDKCVFIHGKKYQLFESDGPVSVFSDFRIHMPMGHHKDTFLQHQAELYLPERCLDIANQMNLSITNIRIKKMKSCWGLCKQNKKITLNQALIQVPIWISDYVMIHECAHIVHFDHSKLFWQLVKQYCNSVKEAKKWLKEHQIVLI